MHGLRLAGCLVALALAACAPARPERASGGSEQPKPAPKHVNAAMMGEPTSLVARFNSTQISLPGAGTLEQLVNGTMLEVEGTGKLQPQLAEAVPTLENGLWKLLPGGRMETSWRIRPGA